jgi:hypothetical protein
MKSIAFFRMGAFYMRRGILIKGEVLWKGAQEVSMKVRCFANRSGKQKKFLWKFNRITKT